MEALGASRRALRVALEGCGHGKLHDIYASIETSAKLKGWDGVDLVIIGGDFQAVRNSYDLNVMSVPKKYKRIGDFHEYYSGKRTAPYLTIFIGGNHEACNHLFELYYGGWVAPNIYYLGAANVLRCGPLRIAGVSGIFKGYDYRKPHFERLPYSDDDVHSAYHVRETDIRKLLQIRTQVDVGLSHDWPKKVEYSGDHEELFCRKPFLQQDSRYGKLGSDAAKNVLERLRPAYWFSAHLHVKFSACVEHTEPNAENTEADVEHPKPDVEHPKTVVEQPIPQTPTSAWNNFHTLAAKSEAEESARFLAEAEQRRKERDGGVPLQFSEVNYQQTWRKIDIDEAPGDRKILGVEKTGFDEERENKKPKVEIEPANIKNSDEIALDLDSLSDTGSVAVQVEKEATKVPNDDDIRRGPDNSSSSPDAQLPGQDQTKEVGEVPEDLRRQLPASFARPQPYPFVRTQPPLNGPHPEAISNTKTQFLALSKCEPHQDFLQLVEFSAVSEQNGIQEERPYRLHYDKEWLAITRALADELRLGDPNAVVPPNKGHIQYKEEIIEAEQWIEEHVVKPGKLEVPENFVPTAPFYDSDIRINTSEQPQEYNNPQTVQFCELIGIENKFYQTDEEREARIAAGPRPANASRDHNRSRGGSSQQGRRGGGRGGGRGRGRGQGYGSMRGRGRGHSQW